MFKPSSHPIDIINPQTLFTSVTSVNIQKVAPATASDMTFNLSAIRPACQNGSINRKMVFNGSGLNLTASKGQVSYVPYLGRTVLRMSTNPFGSDITGKDKLSSAMPSQGISIGTPQLRTNVDS
jgi:hypothetical protein